MANLLQLPDFSKYKTSSWTLIAANLLPLFGVLFFGWDTFSIVFLYWAENVVIGAINVLKMLACNPDANLLIWGNVDPADKLNRERMERSRGDSVRFLRFANQASKLFSIPFFIFHYGLFCFVHGVFIFAIFDRAGGGSDTFGGFDNFKRVMTEQHLWLCLLALAASHLYSFFANYLGKGEYRRTNVEVQMFRPYPRIIVLHVAILIGAFVAVTLGSNVGVLVLLIAGKTMIDLSLHLSERVRNETSSPRGQTPVLPEVIMGEAGQVPATPVASGQSHPPARSTSGG